MKRTDEPAERTEHAAPPSSLSPSRAVAGLLELQQSAGNAAVARMIGAAAPPSLQRAPAPAQQYAPGAEAPTTSPPDGTVDMDRERFSRRCATAHQIVDGKYDLIGAFTKELAVLYGHAWRRHKGALVAANEQRELIAELMISGAVAFATGGAAGAIGKYVQSRFSKDTFGRAMATDSVKDLFKDTSRRFAKANLPPPAQPVFAAFPTDPLEWQNFEESAILREAGWVKLMIAGWSDAADRSPEFATDFDPVERVESLVVAQHRPEELTRPDPLEALRFEKGFWKEWLSHYSHEIVAHDTRWGRFYEVTDNVDKAVRERVLQCAAELGEDGETWITLWAEALRKRLEEEAYRRRYGESEASEG